MIDARTRLRYAVAATRYGGGAATIATKVRREGIDALDATIDRLAIDQRHDVDETADRLQADGIQAVLLGDDGYPQSLAHVRAAPVALFVSGPRQLLDRRGLGVCGSRNATDEGLRAARACGEVVAAHGVNVVSGYARGVALATHTGAVAAGGTTVLVLAEGIDHFRKRRGELTQVWDETRAVVVSQFSPRQPWNAGAAMARNAVISGLSAALVVVEAGDTGGTLAAGLQALERGQPVLVLELFGAPPGNRLLQDKGATVIRSRGELEDRLDDLPTNGSVQLSLI